MGSEPTTVMDQYAHSRGRCDRRQAHRWGWPEGFIGKWGFTWVRRCLDCGELAR